MSWVTPDPEILPHTPANAQLYDDVMVVVSQKLSKKCTVTPGLEPGACESIMLSARPQLLLMILGNMYKHWNSQMVKG